MNKYLCNLDSRFCGGHYDCHCNNVRSFFYFCTGKHFCNSWTRHLTLLYKIALPHKSKTKSESKIRVFLLISIAKHFVLWFRSSSCHIKDCLSLTKSKIIEQCKRCVHNTITLFIFSDTHVLFDDYFSNDRTIVNCLPFGSFLTFSSL